MRSLLGIPAEKAIGQVFALENGGFETVAWAHDKGFVLESSDQPSPFIAGQDGEVRYYKNGWDYPSRPYGRLLYCLTYPNPIETAPKGR